MLYNSVDGVCIYYNSSPATKIGIDFTIADTDPIKYILDNIHYIEVQVSMLLVFLKEVVITILHWIKNYMYVQMIFVHQALLIIR